ncbi:extracellular solute-binding protein [Bacillus solitudinis]|uniref:extracellular solute-binding protein n=1 Tax=Bacillus solitudinis TaxID=2014074 RepID=UPI000C2440A7|nr:extracellular solute-binding protein [Bacillus solitudinis]
MKKVKVSLFISMLVLLVVVSAACSSNDDASSNGDGSKVVIDYWHTYGEQEEKILVEQIKPAFEEEYPEMELKLTRQPVEGLKQQIVAGVAGNASPDLMRMDLAWVPEFAELNALANVSELDGFTEVKEQLFEVPMATNFYNDGYYGLPINTNTKIAIYNKALLEKAGYSEAPATMEELEDAARKAVEAGAKGGISIGAIDGTWPFLPYFGSLGGTLTNADYSQFEGYLNSDESVKALETIVRWQEEGLVSPTLTGGEPGTWEGLERDEYLMIDDGPWFFSILMNEKGKPNPLDYAVWANIPEGDGGSRSVIGGENLVIFENAKNKEAAWTFAKWMTSEEPQAIMARETGLIPSNMAAAEDPEFLELPFVQQYVEQLNTAIPRTPLAEWAEVEAVITLNVEKVIRGEMEPKEALDDAARKADVIIDN